MRGAHWRPGPLLCPHRSVLPWPRRSHLLLRVFPLASDPCLVVLCLMNLFRISFSEGHSHKFSILFAGESSVLVLKGWFGQEYSTRLAGFALGKWGVGRVGLITAAEGSAASFVPIPQRGSAWSLSLLFRGSLDGEGTASVCCWLLPPLCEPGVLLPHRLPLPHSLFLILQLQPRMCQTSPAVISACHQLFRIFHSPVVFASFWTISSDLLSSTQFFLPVTSDLLLNSFRFYFQQLSSSILFFFVFLISCIFIAFCPSHFFLSFF